jgi:hypothetical protein
MPLPKPQVVIIVADVGVEVCDGRHRVIVMKEELAGMKIEKQGWCAIEKAGLLAPEF